MNAGNGHQELVQIGIDSDEDIIRARQKVREIAVAMGFSLLDQTRIVTAVSELARNIVVHAQSGTMTVFRAAERPGLRIVFEDHGPGIADLDKAMQESFSSVGSLGLGLQGAKRLSDAMEVSSSPGRGTTVVITKWL